MEDPLLAKNDEGEFDTLKNSGSEAEDDIGYHSIGRNIKVCFSQILAGSSV